jgi:ubiquinone/menaquinone biosynthesis C-methylase UbiE
MSDDIQYPDHFVARLHSIWGEGFMSPGGPEEVGEIVRDLDLSGKTVLDIGFGTGGPAIALAKKHQAGKVIGIDVEPQLRERALANIEQSGVSDRIDLRIVEPGPLPFDDETFDVVFSKDSMAHIEDKLALFLEVKRVLKPGGVFVASDWLSGSGEVAMAALNEFRDICHLVLPMATAAETENMLLDAGFENTRTRDRNEWYAPVSAAEVERIEGPLKDQLISEVGVEIYDHWLKVRTALSKATTAGGLRPTHFKASKSAS